MKRLITTIAFAAITASTSTACLAADASVAVDAMSAYVWRGLTFNDGIVLQPSIDVTSGGFGINVWSNMDVDDYNGAVEEGEFSEVDLTASYSFSAGPVDAGIGIIEYLFPAGGSSTTELYASAGMDIVGGLSAAATLYYDIDQVEDYYATFGLSYGFDLSDSLSMGFSGDIAYAGEDFAMAYGGGTEAGLFNYVVGFSLDFAASEDLSIGISATYTDSLDDDVLADESVDTKFYGGISIAYAL